MTARYGADHTALGAVRSRCFDEVEGGGGAGDGNEDQHLGVRGQAVTMLAEMMRRRWVWKEWVAVRARPYLVPSRWPSVLARLVERAT